MMKLLSFGRKKEEKKEVTPEEELFPELQRLKEEVEKGTSLGDINNLLSFQQPQQMQLPMQTQQILQPTIPQTVPQPLTQVKEEKPIIEKEEKPELYIKIDDYKKVLDLLDKLKIKIKDLENILTDLKEIKEKESEKLEEIKDQLENTKENINSVLELLRQP